MASKMFDQQVAHFSPALPCAPLGSPNRVCVNAFVNAFPNAPIAPQHA
jgi:hypothetical protein